MTMPLYGKVVVICRNGVDGVHFALTKHQILFGRASDCDIRVQLPDVARLHCCVHLNEDEEVQLTSLNHAYSTKLNGIVITQSERIYHMDFFSISDRLFRFEFPVDSAQRLIRRRPIENCEDVDNEIIIASTLDAEDVDTLTDLSDCQKALSGISAYPAYPSLRRNIAVSQIDESEFGSHYDDRRSDFSEVLDRKVLTAAVFGYPESVGYSSYGTGTEREFLSTPLPSSLGAEMEQHKRCDKLVVETVARKNIAPEVLAAPSHDTMPNRKDYVSETSSGVFDDADSQFFSSVKREDLRIGDDAETGSSGVWEEANSRTNSDSGKSVARSFSDGSTVFADAKHDDQCTATNDSASGLQDGMPVMQCVKDGERTFKDEEIDVIWVDAQERCEPEHEEIEKWQDASDQILPETVRDFKETHELNADETCQTGQMSQTKQVVEEPIVTPKCSDISRSSQSNTESSNVEEQVQLQESNTVKTAENTAQGGKEATKNNDSENKETKMVSKEINTESSKVEEQVQSPENSTVKTAESTAQGGQEAIENNGSETKETKMVSKDSVIEQNKTSSSGEDDREDCRQNTDAHVAEALQDNADDEKDEEPKEIKVDETARLQMEELMPEQEKQAKRKEGQYHKKSGNEFFKTGEYLDAVYAYTQGLQVCPFSFRKDRSVMFANRAACQVKLEHHEEAIEDCTQALDLNPAYLKVWLRRAQVYELTEKLDESLADYKAALDLDPGNPDARAACMRLPQQIQERNEKLKEEMLSKLKDLGNLVLRPFGLSTQNFQLQQDPNSGGYSVNFNRNPTNGK